MSEYQANTGRTAQSASDFRFSLEPRHALGPNQPSILKVQGLLSSRVKLPELETNHSLLPSEERKRARATVLLEERFQAVPPFAVMWALTVLDPRSFWLRFRFCFKNILSVNSYTTIRAVRYLKRVADAPKCTFALDLLSHRFAWCFASLTL